MVLFAGADPLKWTQELVVIAVVLVALSLCYRYRSRVIFLLTGDDKIHGSTLDCCYFTFCKCCGLCSGEWTRFLTSCHCCPSFLYKRNLVKELARVMGMSTKCVEIKNIVVGDLPYDKMRGDFYVAISVGTNPDMVTALQEDKHPKIVHFAEILQLKIRESPLEPRVKITVKELNIAGSEELCELVVSASSILDWSNDETPLKRFQMKAVNSDIERETPPWIAMEFSAPSESRMIETMPNIFDLLKVRTYLPSGGAQTAGTHVANGPSPYAVTQADCKKESIMTSDGTILGTREIHDHNTQAFKYRYRLLDDGGNPIQEPDEADIVRIARMRRAVVCAFGCCDCLTFLLVGAYGLFRLYVWSCYRQFVWLTQAQLNGRTFPISNVDLKELVGKCHAAVDGTGALPGTPCRPNYNQTLTVCNTLPDMNRPEAFVGMIYNLFGWQISGITCFHGICEFRNKIAAYDQWCIIGAIVLIIGTRCCKCWANNSVKEYKRSIQKRAGMELQEARSMMASRAGQTPYTNPGNPGAQQMYPTGPAR